MYIPILLDLYIRDLDKLEVELSSYPDEKSIWTTSGSISNSAGNLCLHICGNLQHFIGAVLGKSGYERNREFEFSAKNVPLEKLKIEISKTKAILESTLHNTLEADLLQIYPVHVLGREMSTLYFLTHLLTHLGYHLGQINYHRRRA